MLPNGCEFETFYSKACFSQQSNSGKRMCFMSIVFLQYKLVYCVITKRQLIDFILFQLFHSLNHAYWIIYSRTYRVMFVIKYYEYNWSMYVCQMSRRTQLLKRRRAIISYSHYYLQIYFDNAHSKILNQIICLVLCTCEFL